MNTTRDGAGGQESTASNVCDRALGCTAIHLSLKFQPRDFHETRIMPRNSAAESDTLILQQFMSSLSQGETNLKTQYKAHTASHCSDRISPGSKRCELPHPFPSRLGKIKDFAAELIMLLQHSDWHFLFSFLHHLLAVGRCCCCGKLSTWT